MVRKFVLKFFVSVIISSMFFCQVFSPAAAGGQSSGGGDVFGLMRSALGVAPAVPVTIAPAGTITTNSPEYSWYPSSGATFYRLKVYNITGATFVISGLRVAASACTGVPLVCRVQPGLPLVNSAYRWTVSAFNADGNSPSAAWRKFTVNVVTAPVTISPNGTIATGNPAYRWYPVSGATSYLLNVYDQTNSRYVIQNMSVATAACTGTPVICASHTGSVLANGAYSWTVSAVKNSIFGPWAAWRGFTVAKPVVPAAPVTISPAGTISGTMPTYLWYASSGATSYRLSVYNRLTYSYVIQNLAVSASVCAGSPSVCSVHPAVGLTDATYQWKVVAVSSAGSSPASAWRVFRVYNPSGFNSPFSSDAAGWTPLNGSWTVGGGLYQTTGLDGVSTSSAYNTSYGTLTYEVRMMRTGCVGCANYIMFRGTPQTLAADGNWYGGIKLTINNQGKYNIGYYKNGSWTYIALWTDSPSISSGWNVVKVTMNGTFAQFFVNGSRIAFGNFDVQSSGQVGVGFFRNAGSSTDTLSIDYATLDMNAPSTLGQSAGGINLDTLAPILETDQDPNFSK